MIRCPTAIRFWVRPTTLVVNVGPMSIVCKINYAGKESVGIDHCEAMFATDRYRCVGLIHVQISIGIWKQPRRSQHVTHTGAALSVGSKPNRLWRRSNYILLPIYRHRSDQWEQ